MWVSEWTLLYVCFTFAAQSWQHRDRKESGLHTTLNKSLQGFFIVHSAIDRFAHAIQRSGLEQCTCTTLMTNIRPDRDSNPVPPSFEPQPGRMSHQGRQQHVDSSVKYIIYFSYLFRVMCSRTNDVASLTHKALIYSCINHGYQRVFIIRNNHTCLSDSCDYLCYVSTATIHICTLTVRWSTLDVRFRRLKSVRVNI